MSVSKDALKSDNVRSEVIIPYINSDTAYKDLNGNVITPPPLKKNYGFIGGTVVAGGYFGDEGKGKLVDIFSRMYLSAGFNILSVRLQGSGNAGHTVKELETGKEYHFHYLPSGAIVAHIIYLGGGMLIDPIKMQEEAQQLPIEQREKICIDERATLITNLDRRMDGWCEEERNKSGQTKVGTTGSGVGPGAGNRGYRFHVTFADALHCKDAIELKELILKNPLYPEVVRMELTDEYALQIWNAIHSVQVVNGQTLINQCRAEHKWAVILEVSQAILLDPILGNGGHFVTSTPCTPTGAMGCGLFTDEDFPDGKFIVAKAYGSKVGGGPFITVFGPEDKKVEDKIRSIVNETGVSTGRKRLLGWFDIPAIRYSLDVTKANLCINCLDVIGELADATDALKFCYAYKHLSTGEVITTWPYFLDEYEPLWFEIPIKGLTKEEIMVTFIVVVEHWLGKKVSYIGNGPSTILKRKAIMGSL